MAAGDHWALCWRGLLRDGDWILLIHNAAQARRVLAGAKVPDCQVPSATMPAAGQAKVIVRSLRSTERYVGEGGFSLDLSVPTQYNVIRKSTTTTTRAWPSFLASQTNTVPSLQTTEQRRFARLQTARI